MKKTKKPLSILLILALYLTLLPTAALAVEADTVSGWDGSVETDWYDAGKDEFTLTSAAQLAGLASLVNSGNTFSGKTIYLNCDIDLNPGWTYSQNAEGAWEWTGGSGDAPSNEWTPIGTSSTDSFSGTFDGQNHTISNMFINGTYDCTIYSSYVGLFGYLKGDVNNLNVTGSIAVTATSDVPNQPRGLFTGGIAGRSQNGTIANCSFSGTISYTYESGNYDNIGGIVGTGYGNITGCRFHGTISGNGLNVGGIVGSFDTTNTSQMSNCYNMGTIEGPGFVGGIAGIIHNNNTVINCYNAGAVIGKINTATGGIVGYSYGTTNIKTCHNFGTVTAGRPIVGGASSSTTFTDCYYLASEETDTRDGTTFKTDAQFASGEVARLLQHGQEAGSGQVWGQRLTGDSADAFPMLTSNTSSSILQVTFKVNASDADVHAYGFANPGGPVANMPADPTPASDTQYFSGWTYSGSSFTAQTAVTIDDITVTATFADKTAQSQPDAPTLNPEIPATANTITINTWSGQSYAITESDTAPAPTATDTWVSGNGTSHTFFGLNAGATYYIWTYRPGGEQTLDSPVSAPLTAYTAPNTGDGYTIRFDTETITIDPDYEVNTAQDFTGTAVDSGDPLAGYMGQTLYIRRHGSGAATEITIPARPNKPEGLNGGVGQITGVTPAMEYQLSNDTVWTPITGGSVTGLAAGEYGVRYKATSSQFASEIAFVTVTAPDPEPGGGSSGGGSEPTYRPTVEATEGGNVTISPTLPTVGSKVTITPQPDNGYQLNSITVIDRNGNPVAITENGDGTYTFIQPNGKVTIEVTFRENIPSASIPHPFTDVPDGAWYEDAVQYVYENGLMMGTAEATFSPNATTNRGMIVTILHRLAGEPAATVSGFTDVDSSAYYAGAVAWAAGAGIVNGVSGDRFAPDSPITREQLAVMLYRYAQHMGYDVSAGADLSGYADAGQISDYALTALQWANAQGLITGTSTTTLTPQGSATRAQVATILMRLGTLITER